MNIYTIELNLDDDYWSSCAYHIDELESTIRQNIDHAETKKVTDRWVLVGLAHSLKKAQDTASEIQKLLCKRNGKEPKFLSIAETEYELD